MLTSIQRNRYFLAYKLKQCRLRVTLTLSHTNRIIQKINFHFLPFIHNKMTLCALLVVRNVRVRLSTFAINDETKTQNK